MDIKYFFIKEKIDKGLVKIIHVKSEDRIIVQSVGDKNDLCLAKGGVEIIFEYVVEVVS